MYICIEFFIHIENGLFNLLQKNYRIAKYDIVGTPNIPVLSLTLNSTERGRLHYQVADFTRVEQ